MRTEEERKAYQAAWYVANKEKIRLRQAAYYAANPEKAKAASRARYAANPEKIKAATSVSNRRRKYGLSPEAFQTMILKQKNVCGICKEIFSKAPYDHTTGVHVDHDHATGEVRGLLCGRCNKALGGFKDSPVLLKLAWEYLRG